MSGERHHLRLPTDQWLGGPTATLPTSGPPSHALCAKSSRGVGETVRRNWSICLERTSLGEKSSSRETQTLKRDDDEDDDDEEDDDDDDDADERR